MDKSAAAAIAVLAFFLAAFIFQLLWNSTMPEVFGLKRVRYWVAFRLLLIASFIASGSCVKLNQGA